MFRLEKDSCGRALPRSISSTQNPVQDFAVDIREADIAAAEAEGEVLVVDA